MLVEQKLTIALNISARVYVMGRGVVVFKGTPDELRDNEQVRKEWLKVLSPWRECSRHPMGLPRPRHLPFRVALASSI